MHPSADSHFRRRAPPPAAYADIRVRSSEAVCTDIVSSHRDIGGALRRRRP